MLLLHLELGLGCQGRFWEKQIFQGEAMLYGDISVRTGDCGAVGVGFVWLGFFCYIDKITTVINSHQVTNRGLMIDSKNRG